MIWDQRRFWMHFPLGVIAPTLSLAHPEPVIGAGFTLGFLVTCLVYQWSEGNKPWIDIQGIIAGLPVGCLIVWGVSL